MSTPWDKEVCRLNGLVEQQAGVIDALHRKMLDVRRKRGSNPCAHLTLSAPHLPCPHPDCYAMPTGQKWLRIWVADDAARRFGFADEAEAARPAPFNEEIWERVSLRLSPSETTWGWRRR